MKTVSRHLGRVAGIGLCLLTGPTLAQTAPLTAEAIVERLDVTSFRSSIGPRRAPGKTTFADYGFQVKTLTRREATLTTANDQWLMHVRILHADASSARLCLTDRAQNGGSYFSIKEVVVRADDAGVLKAVSRDPGETDACRLTLPPA